MTSPLVVSYDNCPNDNTRLFVKTLETNGWNYKLLGMGDVWRGLINKVVGYHDYLKTIDPQTVVILSDARDVFCVRGPKAFLEGWRTFNKDMVVSMELFCDATMDKPDNYVGQQCVSLTKYWAHHNIKQLPSRKFVNSGLVAGRAGELCKWLQWTLDNKYLNDQLALGIYMNLFPERIAIDVDAILLHTSTFGTNAGMHGYLRLQNHDSPTLAELCGRGAFFLHIPGINISKGQAFIYDTVRGIIQNGIGDKQLRASYDYEEPGWNY